MVGDREAPKVKLASLMVSSKILPRRWHVRDTAYLGKERLGVAFTQRFVFNTSVLKSVHAGRDARSGAWCSVARASDAPALRRNRRRTVEDHKVPNPALLCARLSQTTECNRSHPVTLCAVVVKRRRIGR